MYICTSNDSNFQISQRLFCICISTFMGHVTNDLKWFSVMKNSYEILRHICSSLNNAVAGKLIKNENFCIHLTKK